MKRTRRYILPLLLLKATYAKTLFGSLVLLSSTLARADLPTMEAPSRGAGAGLIDTIKNYAYDGGIPLGLLIATLAFLGVAWHSLTVYADVQTNARPGRTLAPWST